MSEVKVTQYTVNDAEEPSQFEQRTFVGVIAVTPPWEGYGRRHKKTHHLVDNPFRERVCDGDTCIACDVGEGDLHRIDCQLVRAAIARMDASTPSNLTAKVTPRPVTGTTYTPEDHKATTVHGTMAGSFSDLLKSPAVREMMQRSAVETAFASSAVAAAMAATDVKLTQASQDQVDAMAYAYGRIVQGTGMVPLYPVADDQPRIVSCRSTLHDEEEKAVKVTIHSLNGPIGELWATMQPVGSRATICAIAGDVTGVAEVLEVVTVEPGVAGVQVRLGNVEGANRGVVLSEVWTRLRVSGPVGIEYRVRCERGGKPDDMRAFFRAKHHANEVAAAVSARERARLPAVQTEADADVDNFGDAP